LAIASGNAAAILIYPDVEVDSSGILHDGQSVETVLALSNTSEIDPVAIHCFLENTTSHCSNNPAQACLTNSDCPVGGTCVAGWSVTGFAIRLTPNQPIGWVASDGLPELPGPLINEGAIPPIPEDPFVGTLRCFVSDPELDLLGDSEFVPFGANLLRGEATIQAYSVGESIFKLDRYNAIGVPAINVGNGDGSLILGGADAEYVGCPNVLSLTHFFDDAVDPITGIGGISTRLALVPCAVDYVGVTPATVTVQYQVFNEFGDQFSTSRMLTAHQVLDLSSIHSLFGFSSAGTLTGQTRITGIESGLVGIARETHSLGLASSALPLQRQGDRADADVIVE